MTGFGRRALLWLPLGLVTAIGIVRLVLPLGRPFAPAGDVAFLELQVRQTLHGVLGVGPYSRFGWHDPGPAMFYLFAPLYWLTGESSRSLFLSSWLLNMGSALVVVALIRRRAGTLAGWIAVAVLLAYVAALGFDPLTNPWNPSVLGLPMLLVAVSAAAAFEGDTRGLLGLASSATFVVQTYVATVPVAALLSVVGVSGYLRSRYRRRPDPAPEMPDAVVKARVSPAKAGFVAITSLVACAWALPVGQQLFGSRGNLGLLVKFALHPPPGDVRHHSLHAAVAMVSDTSTVMGLGAPSDVALHASRLILMCVYAGVGVAGALWWARRRSPFMTLLAATTPVGLIVEVAAATRVTGPLYDYMFRWCSVLPMTALIAVALAAARLVVASWRRLPAFDWSSLALGTCAIALAAVPAVRTTVTSPDTPFSDSPAARLVARQIEAAVGSRSRVFSIRILDGGASDGPLLLTLVKDGYQFRLQHEMNLFYGDTSRPVDGPMFTVAHGDTAQPTFKT